MRTKDYGRFQDQISLDWSIEKDLNLLLNEICNHTDFDRFEARAAVRRVINNPDF
jgi:predicted transposase YbfD/YdcC